MHSPEPGVLAVPLTRGAFALVDIADLALVQNRRWACHVSVDGYTYARSSEARRFYLHRIITAAPRGMLVDHINGNTLDNRRTNLRVVTARQNSFNQHKRRGQFSSKFKGVSFDPPCTRHPWRMTFEGQKKGFATEIEAALAYDQAAKQAYGEFACLNFPVGSDRSALHAPNMREENLPCPSSQSPDLYYSGAADISGPLQYQSRATP